MYSNIMSMLTCDFYVFKYNVEVYVIMCRTRRFVLLNIMSNNTLYDVTYRGNMKYMNYVLCIWVCITEYNVE